MISTFFGPGSLWKTGALALTGIAAVPAAAQEVKGVPTEWQMGLQEGVTPIMLGTEDYFGIVWFHNSLLMPIITAITLFVLGLLIWVMVRYNEKANPVPSKTTHNTRIEVIWTVVPIIILAIIAVPSFRLLTEQRTFPDADLTIKATGHQWYWSYEYTDEDGLIFDSVMLEEEELSEDQKHLRLLEVDNEIAVPVGKTVRLIATAADVIHAWTIPAFGVKIDTIPGRLNEAWFRADQVGIYYGQCSELCGVRHAFMPIKVVVMTEEDYAVWLEEAKAEFAAAPAPKTPTRLAQRAGQ